MIRLDKEAVEALKATIESGTFRVAQATANDAPSILTSQPENSTLFDKMIKKTEENPALSELLFDLSVGKIKYAFNPDEPTIKNRFVVRFYSRRR